MNHLPLKTLQYCLISLAAITLSSSPICGQEAKPEETASRRYAAELKVFSFRPGDESATYLFYGGGSVGPNGATTLGISHQQRHFSVRLAARLKSQRFLATVTVKPIPGDTGTKAQEIDYDLSDLAPRSLEFARDADGRVYMVSILPTIHEKRAPAQFNVADLRLEYWTFPSCPVVLNDQDYIGRLGMGSGPLASFDIPGLANVEFSLLHLKDALPLGTLENGVINIKHDSGTTLQISGVKNGANQDVLSGGPYRVWVRWKQPSQTVEEYRESLKRQIVTLKARINDGDTSILTGTLERLQKMAESGRIGMISGGTSGVKPDDLAKTVE